VVVGAATDWEIRDFGANGQLGTKWSLLPSALWRVIGTKSINVNFALAKPKILQNSFSGYVTI
jgi:hypothetical protein